jgi:hypothetical protein
LGVFAVAEEKHEACQPHRIKKSEGNWSGAGTARSGFDVLVEI